MDKNPVNIKSGSHSRVLSQSILRHTRQREAIQNVFCIDGRPMSVSEVLEQAQATVSTLNQATVYRNINLLVADGWLVQITHPQAGTLYERAGKDHHHHFYCRSCSRVFELPGCPLPKQIETPSLFVIESHELFFNGLCGDCIDAKDSSGKKLGK